MTALLLLADLFTFLLSGIVWLQLRYGLFDLQLSSAAVAHEITTTAISYAVAIGAMLLLFGFRYRHYSQRLPFWDSLFQIATVAVLGMAAEALTFYVLHVQPSRIDFAFQWATLILMLPLSRQVMRRLLDHLGQWQIPVTLLGNSDNAREAWLALCSEPQMGFRLSRIVRIDSQSVPSWAGNVKVLDYASGCLQVQHPREHFLLALEAGQQDMQDEILRQLSRHASNIMLAPPVGRLPTFSLRPMHFMAHESLILSARNLLSLPPARLIKRMVDVIGASLLLILLSPMFLALSLLIARSGRPIFFAHKRIGRHGNPFPCYKFRTMVPNASEVLRDLLEKDPAARAEWDREFKLRNDPRITRVGEFLRKTSLDELPQLWNVLRGEMSLVGPRPVVAEELVRYGEDLCYYEHVRPGMTGLWQVSGRNDVDYDSRVGLDAWYVQNWSLGTDIAILFKTIGVVVKGRGAY